MSDTARWPIRAQHLHTARLLSWAHRPSAAEGAKQLDRTNAPQNISPEALATLLNENVQHYDGLVRDHLSRIQQLILFLATVAGVAGTLLYGYHQYVILLAIPIAGCLIFFVMANLTGEMFALAAHKYFLEQQLGQVLRASLPAQMRELVPPPWDSAGGRISRRSISYKAIQAVGTTVLLVVSAICVGIAWDKMNDYWWLAPIVGIVSLALIIVALISYVQAVLAYGDTLEALKELEAGSNPPGAKKTRARMRDIMGLLNGGSDKNWETWQSTPVVPDAGGGHGPTG
jgi:hypothetical protein